LKRILLVAIGLFTLAVLAVVAYVGVSLWRDDDPELLTSAPEIPAGIDQPATSPTSAAATSASSTGVLRFVVDPGQSSATYIVREKLARLPVENDASGTTQDVASGDVTGELHLTAQGLASSAKSSFRVDLNTLASDERLRDNFVRTNTLRTGQGNNNRYAEFTIESVSGFPANYTEGQEVSLSLTGQMTIKGVTKPVTFEVKARRAGEFLTATADTSFNMSEFGIEPPNVPTARAHDLVRLQVVLVAKQAT
jgi:polyisoprenoid-binding protein YceI